MSPTHTTTSPLHRTTLLLVLLGLATLAGCSLDSEGSAPDQAQESAAPEPSFSFDGPDNAVVGADALQELVYKVAADPPAALAGIALRLNGEVVAEPDDGAVEAGELTLTVPEDLEEGEHTVDAIALPADSAGSPSPAPESEPEVLHAWSFELDTTPPPLEVTEPAGQVAFVADGLRVAGTTEPGARLHLDDDVVDVDDEGLFDVEVELSETGEMELALVATDAAGNMAEEALSLRVLPSRVEAGEIRGVHVTPHAWATPSYRERIFEMAERGQINTVQLDLKDESGLVGYDSQVPLAQEIGAAAGVYDLDDAVAELHDRGLHVVGRIVAFRDKYLADHAWENGDRDWVIQTPGGDRYTGYGGFTSFAHPDVIAYNLDVAEEAAAAGVDGILWDYIRRPDGPAENLVVAGLSDAADGPTMEEAIIEFAARARERLKPYGVDHGASVYGIAATRPTQIAQDIAGMAPHFDYIAPMLYPSHWGPGEYGVSDPNRQPYDIIHRSLEDFLEQVDGSGARIVPWLEDTYYRAYDREQHVRDQHRAALDHGIDEWLMWDPHVEYTFAAYPERDD